MASFTQWHPPHTLEESRKQRPKCEVLQEEQAVPTPYLKREGQASVTHSSLSMLSTDGPNRTPVRTRKVTWASMPGWRRKTKFTLEPNDSHLSHPWAKQHWNASHNNTCFPGKGSEISPMPNWAMPFSCWKAAGSEEEHRTGGFVVSHNTVL